MTDLAERLRQIERNPSPDLWDEITSRPVHSDARSEHGLRHRVAAGLVAAVVSIAAFTFLVSVFRSDDYHRGPTLFTGSSQITLLVSSSGPSGDDALLVGTLTSESGCVGVSGGPDHFVYVVWPEGYSLSDEGGDEWLVDSSGDRIAKFGDEVQMGGGITNLAHAEPSVPGGIPSSCEVDGPDAYWFASTPELVKASYSPTDSEATRLSGIDAYKVCRVLSLPGDFGQAGDEVIAFEEERVPGAGCDGSEGFQHIAVRRGEQITSLSRRLTDQIPDAWRAWPYSTPDLDGDGVDEIAMAVADPNGDHRLWFFKVVFGHGFEVISDDSGPFTVTMGTAGSEPSDYDPTGIFCEGGGGARRIVTWTSSGKGHLDVTETRWHLDLDSVVFDSETTVHIGERGYPDAGDTELCGSPVSQRNVYPTALDEPTKAH